MSGKQQKKVTPSETEVSHCTEVKCGKTLQKSHTWSY